MTSYVQLSIPLSVTPWQPVHGARGQYVLPVVGHSQPGVVDAREITMPYQHERQDHIW